MKQDIIEPEHVPAKTAIQLALLVVVAVVYYFSFDMFVNWLEGLEGQEFANLLGAKVSVKIALGILLVSVTLAIFNVQTLRLRIQHYRVTLEFLKEEFDTLADKVQSINRANESLKHHLYSRPEDRQAVPPGVYPAAYGIKIDL